MFEWNFSDPAYAPPWLSPDEAERIRSSVDARTLLDAELAQLRDDLRVLRFEARSVGVCTRCVCV